MHCKAISLSLWVMITMTACVKRVNIPRDEVRAMCEQIVEIYPAARCL